MKSNFSTRRGSVRPASKNARTLVSEMQIFKYHLLLGSTNDRLLACVMPPT